MNYLYQTAIELRYQGLTYKQISQSLDGKFTPGTLKRYFADDGILHEEYILFAEKNWESRTEEARRIFNYHLVEAAKATIYVMYKAIEQGDLRMVLKSAEVILDRAGMTVAKTSNQKESVDKSRFGQFTQEEIDEELKRRGIDPYGASIKEI